MKSIIKHHTWLPFCLENGDKENENEGVEEEEGNV